MPRIKIDYVVSFSSEDPEHPASNLLAWDVSKKKWLCKRGESSCSVVLQLTKAVKISSIHIGAYHSALVEVLVARSEKASDKFEVLVPSCVFVPPGDSRRDTPVERVRSFTKDQFASDTRDQSWDRLRIVCSQPYNKHCKYGLSFVHIDEPSPALVLPLATYSSDEEEFRPGELFAQHLKNSGSQDSVTDTGAQIRQATSQALKNISDASTKLMKTAINKPSTKRDHAVTSERADRTRDTILYTRDDDRPHDKIDRVVQRHKDQKDKEDKTKPQAKHERKDKVKLNDSVNKSKEDTRTPKRKKSTSPTTNVTLNKAGKHGGSAPAAGEQLSDERRKRPRLSSDDTEQVGEECMEPHTILKDVVLVLSGYENPQRARLRNTALALGARVQRDWDSHCTHLICAFPNTPKLRQVRSAAPAAPAVLGEWVLQCSARRRRLPWRWFATEPQHRTRRTHSAHHSESDTDDEIEKVLRRQTATPEDEGETTEDEAGEEGEEAALGGAGALADVFGGRTFVLDAREPERARLARYVTAYGGLVVQLSQLDEDSSVDYVVQARGGAAAARLRGARVAPAWLARCLRAGELLPPHPPHPRTHINDE